MSSIQSQNEISGQSRTYFGGNEVFFSFLRTIMRAIDRGVLEAEAFESIVRDWGVSLAEGIGLSDRIEVALDQIAEMLSILGLVRVFEPAENNKGEYQVLVLRCMTSRYVGAYRNHQKLPTWNIIPLILEGALGAIGLRYQVTEIKDGMLHSDEYILHLTPKA